MRIMVDIGHPGHAYFFKNFIRAAMDAGNEVKITARDKEVTLAILSSFGFPFEKRGEIKHGLLRKGYDLLKIDYSLYKIARDFNPDILLGFHNPYIAHLSKFLGKPSIIFTDTEGVWFASVLTYPFANAICTPTCFLENLDPKKHVRFNGYKELAYLHPNHFKPDEEIIRNAGLSKDEPFIVLRFISWSASHDIGLKGIRKGTENEIIGTLEQFGRVLITSEKGLPESLAKYRIPVAPQHMHSLLYYAHLYIGEGGTMAAESAVLGTPAIHIEKDKNGRPTGESSGNFLELRNKYDLLHFYASQEEALEEAVRLLSNPRLKLDWQMKREALLSEKTDVTAWMIDFIERYPQSFTEYRNTKSKVS